MVMKEFTAGERLFAADLNDNFDETQLAENILSGTLNADRIPNLSANKITSDTLNADRIPNLDAAKITTGTLDRARIPIKGIGANIVEDQLTSTFNTFSTSFVNVPGLVATITPSSATSKVLVLANFAATRSSDGSRAIFQITATSGGNIVDIAAASQGASTIFGTSCLRLHSPGTTSPVTYQVQLRGTVGGGSSIGVSATDAHATLTLIEVLV